MPMTDDSVWDEPRRGAASRESASAAPPGWEFLTHEVMMGYLAEGEWPAGIDYPAFQAGYLQGRPKNNFVYTDLQLSTDDVDAMVSNPQHPMRIDGTCSGPWWGDAAIVNGTFQIFVNDSPNPYFDNLFYYWQMDGGELGTLTFYGFKDVTDNLFVSVVDEQLLLYTRVYKGAVPREEVETATPWLMGQLNLYMGDFIRYNILGMRFTSLDALLTFGTFFLEQNLRFMQVKFCGRPAPGDTAGQR
jgi:hypothetical protein